MQRLSRLTLEAIVAFLVCASAAFGQQQPPSEAAALAISGNIQANHMPFGTILDPVYAAPASDEIIGYTHCGDSALWTGAYLAAEAFRYGVTRSPDALMSVKAALSGLKGLSDVTGDNRLARCMFFSDSLYALGMENEEAHNTIHQNSPWIWIGNTSRDQIVGAFFGLGVAYDIVDDDWVKSTVSDLTTRLIGFISRHRWSPNDDYSSTFQLRPESLQMLLQVARHVNPSNSVHGPFFVAPVEAAVFVDVQNNDSYYKFNLDYMSLYHLVRLQDNDDNRRAYDILRSYTALHQNAFFDIVDRALGAVNFTRDAELCALLGQWLQRPRRTAYVDLTSMLPMCGADACSAVPVVLRPPSDYLWQRNPFQVSGGSYEIVENAGIDYILPYWMGRYYGVIAPDPVQPAVQ
jgi:hypothetical protein